ncbi:nuclease-related domain-containing protein [Paenibacillus puerhi]|uniref:nuclease-related domain-containing protein n=1 Tax=Paenibacillus puerhi TaxID=2692622 RepID=UPI0022A75F64|nr:nuclease-related domain-containing protein [Paenibacillus puerhi]
MLRRSARRLTKTATPQTPLDGLHDGRAQATSGVAQQLNYIGGAYHVLHGRRVKGSGSPQEIDHLVIGPNGVFHIDANPWSGEIRFEDQAPGANPPEVAAAGDGEKGRIDPTAPLYRYEFVIKELLRQHKVRADVVGIVCFTHPNSRLIGASKAFAALKADQLVPYIKNYRPTRTLSPADVASIERILRENSE